jgi:hypothetical protein
MELPESAFSMKRITTLETTVAPAVRAPTLRRVVDAMMALRENPTDRKAKIQLALLEKEGASDCPACGVAFELSGYRVTKTEYTMRATLRCTGCRQSYLLDETHVV